MALNDSSGFQTSEPHLNPFFKDKRLLGLSLLTVFSFVVGVTMLLQANNPQTYSSNAASGTTSVNVWPPFITQDLITYPPNTFPTKEHDGVHSVSDTQTHTGSGYSVKVGSDKSWGAFYVQNLLSTPVTLTFVQDCREDLAGFENCPGYVPGMTATQLKALKSSKDIVVAGNQILSVYVGVNCWPYQLDINSPFSHGRNIPPGGGCQTTPTATPTVKIPTGVATAVPPTATNIPLPAISCESVQPVFETDGTWSIQVTAFSPSQNKSVDQFYAKAIMGGVAQQPVPSLMSGQGNYLPMFNAPVMNATYVVWVAPIGSNINATPPASAFVTSKKCEYIYTGGQTIISPTPVPISCIGIYKDGNGRYSVTIDRPYTGDVWYVKYINNSGTTYGPYVGGQDSNSGALISLPSLSSGSYSGYVSYSANGPFVTSNACKMGVTPTPTKPVATVTATVKPITCTSFTKINPANGIAVTANTPVSLKATFSAAGNGSALYRVVRINGGQQVALELDNTVIPNGSNTTTVNVSRVQIAPIEYQVQTQVNGVWAGDAACTQSYFSLSTPPTTTLTPTKTPTPTPVPWRFLGCYSDPHCWIKSFTTEPTESYQKPPGTTYHPAWPVLKNLLMLKTADGHTLEYQMERYSTQSNPNGSVIRDIRVDGVLLSKSTSLVTKAVVDSTGKRQFVVITKQGNCGTDSAGKVKHCQNPQVWWRNEPTTTGMLVNAYMDILGRKLPTVSPTGMP